METVHEIILKPDLSRFCVCFCIEESSTRPLPLRQHLYKIISWTVSTLERGGPNFLLSTHSLFTILTCAQRTRVHFEFDNTSTTPGATLEKRQKAVNKEHHDRTRSILANAEYSKGEVAHSFDILVYSIGAWRRFAQISQAHGVVFLWHYDLNPLQRRASWSEFSRACAAQVHLFNKPLRLLCACLSLFWGSTN